jgi:hypothetical protein
MTDKEMKREARLLAIEHLLVNLIAQSYVSAGADEDSVEASLATTRLGIKRSIASGPVHKMVDELESNVLRLLTAATEIWKLKTRP